MAAAAMLDADGNPIIDLTIDTDTEDDAKPPAGPPPPPVAASRRRTPSRSRAPAPPVPPSPTPAPTPPAMPTIPDGQSGSSAQTLAPNVAGDTDALAPGRGKARRKATDPSLKRQFEQCQRGGAGGDARDASGLSDSDDGDLGWEKRSRRAGTEGRDDEPCGLAPGPRPFRFQNYPGIFTRELGRDLLQLPEAPSNDRPLDMLPQAIGVLGAPIPSPCFDWERYGRDQRRILQRRGASHEGGMDSLAAHLLSSFINSYLKTDKAKKAEPAAESSGGGLNYRARAPSQGLHREPSGAESGPQAQGRAGSETGAAPSGQGMDSRLHDLLAPLLDSGAVPGLKPMGVTTVGELTSDKSKLSPQFQALRLAEPPPGWGWVLGSLKPLVSRVLERRHFAASVQLLDEFKQRISDGSQGRPCPEPIHVLWGITLGNYSDAQRAAAEPRIRESFIELINRGLAPEAQLRLSDLEDPSGPCLADLLPTLPVHPALRLYEVGSIRTGLKEPNELHGEQGIRADSDIPPYTVLGCYQALCLPAGPERDARGAPGDCGKFALEQALARLVYRLQVHLRRTDQNPLCPELAILQPRLMRWLDDFATDWSTSAFLVPGPGPRAAAEPGLDRGGTDASVGSGPGQAPSLPIIDPALAAAYRASRGLWNELGAHVAVTCPDPVGQAHQLVCMPGDPLTYVTSAGFDNEISYINDYRGHMESESEGPPRRRRRTGRGSDGGMALGSQSGSESEVESNAILLHVLVQGAPCMLAVTGHAGIPKDRPVLLSYGANFLPCREGELLGMRRAMSNLDKLQAAL